MQAPAKLIVLSIALLLSCLAVVYRTSRPDHEPQVEMSTFQAEPEVAPGYEAEVITDTAGALDPSGGVVQEQEPDLGSRPALPDGVVLERASEEVNLSARAQLEEAFGPDGKGFLQHGLTKDGLVCGPFLWAELRDDPKLREADSIPVEIVIPGSGSLLEGRAIRGDGLALFLGVLQERYSDFEAPAISYPASADYAAFWAMSFFDIEEPLFVLNSGDRRILVNFGSQSTLFWIDDYSNLPNGL